MDLRQGYEALLAEGRKTGTLTLGQVTAHLPVEEMDTLALARILEKLEAAGIQVDVDPDLARGRLDTGEEGETVADTLPEYVPPPPATPAAPMSLGEGRERRGGGSLPPPARGPMPARPWSFWTVMAALAIVLVVALGVVVLSMA